MRHEYRITKYDPRLRNAKGHYTRDEWTFFAQVGRRVAGRVVTMAEYLRTERKYLQVLEAMLREAGVTRLEVRDLRWTDPRVKKWRKQRTVTIRQALAFARLSLRERLDGILVAPREAYVHFGWDYYVYVGLSRPARSALDLAGSLGLFAESCPSPYKARHRRG